MTDGSGSSVGKLIRNLLLVLVLGALCAIIAAGAVLYYFGPTGSYSLTNVLISPQVASELTYVDTSTSSGKQVRYVFDRMEFLYFNVEKNDWHHLEVDLPRYQKLYEMVSKATSMAEVPDHVRNSFSWENPAILTVVVRREGMDPSHAETKAFQEVQFSETGDYFRVQHRDQTAKEEWVYFYSPGIYQKVVQVLVQQQ